MENPEINQSEWNEPFFKERTNGKCVSVGISFMANRFLKIIQLAWPVLLVCSILLTSLSYVVSNARIQIGNGFNLGVVCLSIVVLIILFALLAAFSSRCVDVSIEQLDLYSISQKYIYNRIFKDYLLRALIVFAFFTFVSVIILLIPNCIQLLIGLFDSDSKINTESGITVQIVKLLFLIITLVVIMPLPMVLNVSFFEHRTILFDFKNGYIAGWRKWGRLFALFLLVGTLMALLSLVIMAPAYVISLIQHAESLSRMQGDAVNVPAFLPFVTFLILFSSSFIISVIIIAVYLPFAYLYAAIKAADNDLSTLTGKS